LFQEATDGDLVLCTSPGLLAELRDVLARPHLASRIERQRTSVGQAVALYVGLSVNVTPAAIPRIVPDTRTTTTSSPRLSLHRPIWWSRATDTCSRSARTKAFASSPRPMPSG